MVIARWAQIYFNFGHRENFRLLIFLRKPLEPLEKKKILAKKENSWIMSMIFMKKKFEQFVTIPAEIKKNLHYFNKKSSCVKNRPEPGVFWND